MTVIIYRRAPSKGAVLLAQTLREMGVPAVKRRRLPRRPNPDDVRVAWGDPHGQWAGRELNASMALLTKRQELLVLRSAGVPTVRECDLDGCLNHEGEMLARSNYHHGGLDLLAGHELGDYYVHKENITKEFRLHIFEGLSIRAGVKVPRMD